MARVTGKQPHVFGRRRPSHSGDYVLHGTEVRVTTFRDLPSPTGTPPFRLDLKDVLSSAAYRKIVNTEKLVFHLNGDMGGIGYAVPQELVAKGMETDLATPVAGGGPPAFLYITGDCVYFNGEMSKYYQQFYQP